MPVDNVDHEESHEDDEKSKYPGDAHITTTKRETLIFNIWMFSKFEAEPSAFGNLLVFGLGAVYWFCQKIGE